MVSFPLPVTAIPSEQQAIADRRFQAVTAQLPGLYRQLLDARRHTHQELSFPKKPGKDRSVRIPEKGIYVFFEAGVAKYVGLSKRPINGTKGGMRERIIEHSSESGRARDSSLAFIIAGIDASNNNLVIPLPPGKTKHTRTTLMANTDFAQLFNLAKQRIKAMQVSFIEVIDDDVRPLLEIYTAWSLDTHYNTF